jgi:hypothetical protein
MPEAHSDPTFSILLISLPAAISRDKILVLAAMLPTLFPSVVIAVILLHPLP